MVRHGNIYSQRDCRVCWNGSGTGGAITFFLWSENILPEKTLLQNNHWIWEKDIRREFLLKTKIAEFTPNSKKHDVLKQQIVTKAKFGSTHFQSPDTTGGRTSDPRKPREKLYKKSRTQAKQLLSINQKSTQGKQSLPASIDLSPQRRKVALIRQPVRRETTWQLNWLTSLPGLIYMFKKKKKSITNAPADWCREGF